MKKSLIKYKSDIYALIFLTLIVLFYFLKLFYPKPSIFVTPDIALSDVLNLNYSLKEFLSFSLKNHELPLWSKDLQNGFPVLAESQIGALNFLNLFLFYFFPTWLAFNLTYIISFLTAGFSMFFYLRYLGFKTFPSLFGSLAFTFSGPLVFQISHPNLLQAASMLPFLFLITEFFLRRPGFFSASSLAFLLSQQVFFGFPQTTFLTLIAISLYIFFFQILKLKHNNEENSKFSTTYIRSVTNCAKSLRLGFLFLFAIFLFFALSAIQILPTFEYARYSSRKFGLDPEDVLHHSFHPLMFLTLLNPYLLGSPKTGNFSFKFFREGALYWESVAYFGIIPLLFVFLLFLKFNFFLKNRPKDSCFTFRFGDLKPPKGLRVKFFPFLAVFSFFLMLGKYSPLYFLFSFPPFNNFRMPSRFVLLFVFSLIVISTYSFQNFLTMLKRQKLGRKITALPLLIILITTADLFFITYNYQPTESVNEVLSLPETAKFLKALPGEKRVFPYGGDAIWKQTFLDSGFKKINLYSYYRNDLNPNINLLYGITSARGFLGSNFFLLRKILLEKEIVNNVTPIDIKNWVLSVPKSSLNLLRIYGVNYIVSPFTLVSDGLLEIFKTKALKEEKPYRVYKIKNSSPRIFFPEKFEIVKTFESSLEKLTSENFNPKKEVVLSKKPPGLKSLSLKIPPHYQILEDKNQSLIIKIKAQNPAILVLNDTDYPGWKAYLNKQKVEILRANIVNRAVFIPKGSHLLEFKFKPESFRTGLVISAGGLIFIIFQLGFPLFSFFLGKFAGKS